MGRVRDDNAIGTGLIPKMAGLAGLDTTGPVEPASAMATPTGNTHEVVKEAVMSSHFLPAGCLMFLCTLIALGATTAEAWPTSACI